MSIEAGSDGRLKRERPGVGVIIPALNEEKAIGLVLRDIPRSAVDQVIVVDNGSSDSTAREAKSYGAMVKYEPVRGYGSACLTGLKALGPEIEIVVFLDADYSDHPEEIPTLLSPISENQADFVIGSRTIRDTSRRTLSWQQLWGNWLATKLIRWRFRYPFTDLGPFRAIRRGVLEALSMKDRSYGWTVEMQVKAACAGLRILEVPVDYRPRIGHSKISGTLRGAVGAGVKILYTIGRHALKFKECRQPIASKTMPEE